MKTVQVVFDEELLAQLDRLARQRRLSRSAFIRRCLDEALEAMRVRELEEHEAAAYRARPPTAAEARSQRALGKSQRSVLESESW